MAVFFCYLVKRDLSSVRYCIVAHTTVTFYTVPEQHSHIYLVTLYLERNYEDKVRSDKNYYAAKKMILWVPK